jgi:hypothetical protein
MPTYPHPLAFGLLFLGIGYLLNTPSVSQAAKGDDYLLEIEAEAKRQATIPISSGITSISASVNATERLPLGLQKEDFEKALRDNVAGTYVFYEQLTPQNKEQIFSLYQRDNRVGSIREHTLRLLGAPQQR